ncbi:hypothetical protein LQZ19_00450 [Treponema primitia]|uniref:hypothetical protein n=1 Tax=Treponema primitia TaxID=88058 RepID=UPI003980CFDE
MSSVITIRTPFINRDILLQALDRMGCAYTTIHAYEIALEKSSIPGHQMFYWKDGKYSFQHETDSDREHKGVHVFLGALEKEYNDICSTSKEAEKERQEYIQKQKETIILRAKERGYSVREERVKEKIKLVLVRNSY